MTDRIVIVVGSGASKEAAGLPVGEELKSDIATLLDLHYEFGNFKKGDSTLGQALQLYLRQSDLSRDEGNAYLPTAWHIRDTLPLALSIDNYIDNHRDDPRIAFLGKLAIVRAILKAEKKSKLYFEENRSDGRLKFDELSNTWYVSFFRLITENCSRDQVFDHLKNITLIVFNYDRCIEHFLFAPLKKYYKLTDQETIEILGNLEIFHPYGSVGPLSWEGSDTRIRFGHEPNHFELLELVNGIKTFTEGTDPKESRIKILRNRVHAAKQMIFLGFAFHPLNMKLLRKPGASSKINESFYATTLGISKSDEAEVIKQARILTTPHIKANLFEGTCHEFFGEFWRSLSLS